MSAQNINSSLRSKKSKIVQFSRRRENVSFSVHSETPGSDMRIAARASLLVHASQLADVSPASAAACDALIVDLLHALDVQPRAARIAYVRGCIESLKPYFVTMVDDSPKGA